MTPGGASKRGLDRDKAVLRCCGIHKSFNGVCALADMTLEFPACGVTAIVGPNGAGKTTLLNVITGLSRPDRGRVSMGECELTGLAPHQIVRLGIARAFQEVRLIMRETLMANVLAARPNQKGESLLRALLRIGWADEEEKNREEAFRLLRFVGLEGWPNVSACELSYGQQKLLSLACCLATDARILLLDEPVAGVHPGMVERILGLLRQLREMGKLVVCIEHDIAFVRQVADTVVVMDEGRIIAQGRPSEVLERPEIMEAYVG